MRVTRYGLVRGALSFAVLFAALAAGAHVHLAARAPVSPQERPPFKLTGQEGMIEGVVNVAGAVPPGQVISMAADPACASQNQGGVRADDLVVTRGRLANALVYVESAALDAYAYAPRPWDSVLGRRRCMTTPRVVALQAGDTLSVQNGDRTKHNYDFQTKANPIFNRFLAPGESFEVLYARPEPPFVVRCRLHPWERGYVAVLPHPFFYVTGRGGSFAIQGLPPGEYEVVVWHEKFKETRAKVTIGPKETKDVNFTLKYPADSR